MDAELLRGLVVQWRHNAQGCGRRDTHAAGTWRSCARDLEAALSVAQGQGWRLMGRMTIGGVVWEGPNPHDSDANAPGTRYYAAPAQPDGVES